MELNAGIGTLRNSKKRAAVTQETRRGNNDAIVRSIIKTSKVKKPSLQ